MPSPVFALAPTVQSVPIGARWYCTRIARCARSRRSRGSRRGEPESAAAPRFRPGRVPDYTPRTTPSSTYRSSARCRAAPARRRRAARPAAAAISARPMPTRSLPVAFAHMVRAPTCRLRSTPRGMTLEHGQPHVILSGSPRRSAAPCRTRLEAGLVGAQLARVERLRLDRAAARPAAGSLGVVVGIARAPSTSSAASASARTTTSRAPGPGTRRCARARRRRR